MERREREAILGEWGVRDEGPLERAARDRLARDLEGSPLVGQPLLRRLSLRPGADAYLLSLGGPLPYMQRLREIEAETAAHERALEAAWRDLAAATSDAATFAKRWRRRLARWSFSAVNELIERHNRYYPIEARLPMDVRSGDFALVNGERYERRPLDETWALERFPASLAAARDVESRRARQADGRGPGGRLLGAVAPARRGS
jgi:hypothetical protein